MMGVGDPVMVRFARFALAFGQQGGVVTESLGDGADQRADVGVDLRLFPSERVMLVIFLAQGEQFGRIRREFDLAHGHEATDGFELPEDFLRGEGLEAVARDEGCHGNYRAPDGVIWCRALIQTKRARIDC